MDTTQNKKSAVREKLIRKKKHRRKIAVYRAISCICAAAVLIGAAKLVSMGVSSLLNKNVTFVTKLKDTPQAKVSNSLSAKEENDLIAIAKITPTDPKVCYLTFDDGPNNTVTLQIADILRRYDARATFFEIGTLIEEYPDVTRRLHNEGHLIANHSFAHSYSELYASADIFMNEINQTYGIIKSTLSAEPFKLVRFPGGGYNAGKYAQIKQECKQLLKNEDYYFADWNCMTGDAEGGKKTAEQLLEGLKKTLNGQAQAVVLMHDAVSKKSTVEALPMVLDYLISEGYSFDTLEHLRTE